MPKSRNPDNVARFSCPDCNDHIPSRFASTTDTDSLSNGIEYKILIGLTTMFDLDH